MIDSARDRVRVHREIAHHFRVVQQLDGVVQHVQFRIFLHPDTRNFSREWRSRTKASALINAASSSSVRNCSVASYAMLFFFLPRARYSPSLSVSLCVSLCLSVSLARAAVARQQSLFFFFFFFFLDDFWIDFWMTFSQIFFSFLFEFVA